MTCSTTAGIRDFDQVVRPKGLTIPQLVKTGIAESVARPAVGLGPLGSNDHGPWPLLGWCRLTANRSRGQG